jgi:hypothetical protein
LGVAESSRIKERVGVERALRVALMAFVHDDNWSQQSKDVAQGVLDGVGVLWVGRVAVQRSVAGGAGSGMMLIFQWR